MIISHSTIRHVQPEPTNPVLSDIDQQLARINKEMDNLQAERNNIKTAVNTGREDDGSCPGDLSNQDFKGVLLIEEECIRYAPHTQSLSNYGRDVIYRLRESERLLRQEMLLATAAASATEQSLKSLVTRLQEQIHMLVNEINHIKYSIQLIISFQRNPGTSGGSIHGETGPDPEEESSNDVTSEHSIFSHGRPFSALPLRSSTPPAQPSRTALLSGIKIDGPTHERPSSDRPPSAPPLFPSHNPVARLARIESELNQARNDVEDKDKLISTLQAQLVALQNAAQAGTFREMGGAKDDKKGRLTSDLPLKCIYKCFHSINVPVSRLTHFDYLIKWCWYYNHIWWYFISVIAPTDNLYTIKMEAKTGDDSTRWKSFSWGYNHVCSLRDQF